MKRIFTYKMSVVVLLFSAFFLAPVKTSDGCATVKVKDADVNVVLPIAELQGLIQQLQDAGSQVVGEAGVQIRQSIAELSAQMEQRIDQIKNAGSELIAEAATEMKGVINELMTQAKALLAEVDKMIKSNIQCIDYVLAQRIQQILDGAYGVLDRVDVTLKNAIDRVYIRATMLVDTSTSRVAIVVDKTLLLIARIILLVLCFILLFWLVRTLYLHQSPKAKALAIGIPVFVVLLVGGGVFLLVSKTALGQILVEKIEVPAWQNSCSSGEDFYNQFIEMKNQGKTLEELKPVGKKALEQLNWCIYATVSPEIAAESSSRIAAINAVLFPPAIPPSFVLPAGENPCNPSTGPGFSIKPEWFGKYNIGKIDVLNKLSKEKVLINQVAIDKNLYKTNLIRINPEYKVPIAPTVPMKNYQIETKQINPAVLEKLN
jgi:vacuolar-type H+-ATPase subunit H